MKRGFKVFQIVLICWGTLSLADPPTSQPLKLEAPKPEQSPPNEFTSKKNCRCEQKESEYSRSTDTANAMVEALHLTFGNAEKATVVTDTSKNVYIYQGISYDASERLRVNAGKVGHTRTNGVNASIKFGRPQSSEGNDFSEKIKAGIDP